MPRLLRRTVPVLVWFAFVAAALPEARRQPAAGRPLTIEDYYRIQTVGSPSISPNGAWVSFTVATRIEEDNSTRTETWVVPTDALSQPQRVLHYGHDVAGVRWSEDSKLEYAADRQQWRIDPLEPFDPPVRMASASVSAGRGGRGGRSGGEGAPSAMVPSPDGKWLASTIDKPQPRRDPQPVS